MNWGILELQDGFQLRKGLVKKWFTEWELTPTRRHFKTRVESWIPQVSFMFKPERYNLFLGDIQTHFTRSPSNSFLYPPVHVLKATIRFI